MSQKFTTIFNSPNPYVTHTLNNVDLVNTLTNEKKTE